MDDIWPQAVYRPMPYVDALPPRAPVPIAAFHTNGGKGTSLYRWFSRADNTNGKNGVAHLQFFSSGVVEQYVPFSKQAYAQFAGNKFAVSMEFQDDADPRTPLTRAQVESALAFLRWAKVPAQLCSADGKTPGVGWHQMYKTWNKNSHHCPGPVRVAQILDVVLPALSGPTDKKEDDVIKVLRTTGTKAQYLVVNGLQRRWITSPADANALINLGFLPRGYEITDTDRSVIDVIPLVGPEAPPSQR